MSLNDDLTGVILAAAENVEKKLDDEIASLENLDSKELEKLRQERLNTLKKEREQIAEWRSKDHGLYTEIPEERCFFDIVRGSERCVIHFYRDSTERCKIVDMHLKSLAPAHFETRFAKMNVDKSPFLNKNLNVHTLPTILMVIKQQVVDRLVGFSELGNRDDFSTQMIEWRLGCSQVLDYDGDIRQVPNDAKKTKTVTKNPKKTIREDDSDLSD